MVLDVSFFIHKGSIDRSSTTCQVTPVLFPLFQSFDSWTELMVEKLQQLKACNDSRLLSLFQETLNRRDRLWVFLSESPFIAARSSFLPCDEAQFIVQWTWLKKSLNGFQESLEKYDPDLKQSINHPMQKTKQRIDTSILQPDFNIEIMGWQLSR